jgi:hypothetical protein
MSALACDIFPAGFAGRVSLFGGTVERYPRPTAVRSGEREQTLHYAVEILTFERAARQSPVDRKNVLFAALAASLKGEGVEPDEVYTSNSGSIAVDWDEDPENLLSLMISDAGQIGFVLSSHGEKRRGWADYDGNLLPEAVGDVVRIWKSRNDSGSRQLNR